MISLNGIFPPIPTPFDSDESIDFDKLRSNLTRWNTWPLAGFVVSGSTGESVSLSGDERVELVRAVRSAIPSEKLLIAGAGLESTRETVRLVHRMAEAGADAVIVVTPSYFAPSIGPAGLLAHYRSIAEASDLPVILYSVPIYTHLDLPLEVVRELATHPNMVGIKESGGSLAKITSLVSQTPEDFQVLVGSAGLLLGALTVGVVGCVPALGSVAGNSIHELLAAFQRGSWEQAREIQTRLVEPNELLSSRFGVPGVKAALDLLGFYGGPLRSPLRPLGEPELAVLRDSLGRAGLI
ncbi:MAG TPA: dihydrodipicolinate synthase family protein [Anaerolineales bacterium]|nr:dihydrodipicolinate synthase family protein [Anaerolineales bacterium]